MANLSLLNDVVFKVVFGAEANTPILRALLNALLKLEGEDRIVELHVLNPDLEKEHFHEKGAVLDIRARDSRRRQYNIEVQVSGEPAFVLRALYYLSRLFAGQLDKGEPYSQLAKTIGISLVDFVLFRDQEDLLSRYRMYDVLHGKELSDLFELNFIELPKFCGDKPGELRTAFEKWLHVLKFGDSYESGSGAIPEDLAREEGIKMALDEMWKASSSERVRELVEFRMRARREWASMMERAELEGRQKGLEKGREEGRRDGLLEAARRMRQAGQSAETIAQATGLSLAELEE